MGRRKYRRRRRRRRRRENRGERRRRRRSKQRREDRRGKRKWSRNAEDERPRDPFIHNCTCVTCDLILNWRLCTYSRSHGKIAITVITSNGGKTGER